MSILIPFQEKNLPFCAGVVVFYQDQLILVTTPHGHKGFPKGKRHQGETTIQTALRELKEETGIDEKEMALLPDVHIDETKNGRTISVRYLIGLYIGIYPRSFKFDAKELKIVEWCKIDDALRLTDFELHERRKNVIREAVKKLRNE